MLLSNLGDMAPSLLVPSEGYLGTWPPRNISQPPHSWLCLVLRGGMLQSPAHRGVPVARQ